MSGSFARPPLRSRTPHRAGDPLDLSRLSRTDLRLLEQLAAGWEVDAIAQRNGWSRRRARHELDTVLRSVGLSSASDDARRAICSALKEQSESPS